MNNKPKVVLFIILLSAILEKAVWRVAGMRLSLFFIIGLIVGFIGGSLIPFLVDKSMFFDERYWTGWGKGYEACHKVEKEKNEKS